MRARDARDLAALADEALRSLPVLAVEPAIALRHLVRALRAEAARKRRRPDDGASPAAARAADTLEVVDPTDGQHLRFTRAEEDDSAVEAGAVAYMTRPGAGHYLHRTDALKLAEWLTAVACEAPRGES